MSEGDALQRMMSLLLNQSPFVALLGFIIWAGTRKKWVFGWTYDKEVADKEEWKALALASMREQGRAVAVADRSARVLETVATGGGQNGH